MRFPSETSLMMPQDQDAGRNPVVAGVDGSPSSLEALRWAAESAAQRGLPLAIVTATEDGWGEEAQAQGERVSREAGRLAREARPGLDVDARFTADNPAHALIEASYNASLVVVGSRGHGGFHDMLLGSTSLHTAMHARSPVAVIRPRSAEPAPGSESAGRVIVGVDGSKRSAAAIDFAFDEAARTGRGVTAIHAWQGPITAGTLGMMPYVPGNAEQRESEVGLLDNTLRPWLSRYPRIDVHKLTPQMSPAAAMVRQSMGAHLAVVGSRGLGGFSGLLLGSTGQALIHHAGCPVVIVHGHLVDANGNTGGT